MPPVFLERSFRFLDGKVPDHINDTPLGHARNLGKYAVLVEYDGLSHVSFVATDIDDPETATALAEAYLFADSFDSGSDGARLKKTAHVLPPEGIKIELGS